MILLGDDAPCLVSDYIDQSACKVKSMALPVLKYELIIVIIYLMEET